MTNQSAAGSLHTNGLTITPEQAGQRWYRRAIEDELAATAALDERQLAELPINHPEILAYRSRILGGSAGSPGYAGWTDALLATYGPRRSCLSLGSGVGRVESHMLATGFAPSFDAVELSPHANRSAANRDARIGALSGDLNFVQLPEQRYDFILCHGILHHLINLEHVLWQIDRALTADGVLLVYEYVGEDRWQFDHARIEALRSIAPSVPVRTPARWDVRGFESVRSAELPGLLEHQFGDRCERSVSYGGLYFPFVVGAPTRATENIRDVLRADESASDRFGLPPCYHMGVYRKTGAPAASVRPWSDDELRDRLAPPRPLARRAIDELRRSPAGPALRRVRRAARGMTKPVGLGSGSGALA